MLRPACEAAVEVARAAASAQPPVTPAGPLRPLLKLRHLPDRALGSVRRVLEEDELFRSVVASATTEDLVGRPSWLYLQRPDGWEAALTEAAEEELRAAAEEEEARSASTAARRLAAVEASLRKTETDAAAARDALAGAKEQLAEERRARRAADTEAGRLRQRVAELEVLEPPVEEAVDAEEVAELRAEVSRLQDALAAAREAASSPAPAVDRTLVHRAVDDLDRARDELRRWLADERRTVPTATSSPAGPRRRPAPLPPAVFDDTVEAAEHLVRLPGVVVLVDGYNVTKGRHPELPLAEQRAWLLDAGSGLAARCDAEIHVVFDGDEEEARSPATGPRRTSIHVRFTEAGVEADDDLLALVATVPADRPVVVVTDDRRIRDGAAAHGVNLVGSGTFAEVLRRSR